MSTTLASWPRPHLGSSEHEAFLFFAVFSNGLQELPLSSSKYRVAGVPDGFQIREYERSKQPEVFDEFLSGYVWEVLQEEDPELAAEIESSTHCVILRGSQINPETLDYLRDSVGLTTYFLDRGGFAVYDPQIFKWWRAQDWREEVFEPGTPSPDRHVVILSSPEDDAPELTWFHTRGLRKFGRPDISVHRVHPSYEDDIVDLCDRFINYQALGGVIAEGQTIKMGDLPAGGVARHGGDVEDPDFNNVHVEIVWANDALSQAAD